MLLKQQTMSHLFFNLKLQCS